nr:MAG TPA: hypothetical protein [Bacteriophage sp.]
MGVPCCRRCARRSSYVKLRKECGRIDSYYFEHNSRRTYYASRFRLCH